MRTFVLAATTAIVLTTVACGTSGKSKKPTAPTTSASTAVSSSSAAPAADFLHDGFAPAETPVKGGG